jgi:hypothetical protein
MFTGTAFDMVALASGPKSGPRRIDVWAKAAKVTHTKREEGRTSTNSIGWFFGRC